MIPLKKILQYLPKNHAPYKSAVTFLTLSESQRKHIYIFTADSKNILCTEIPRASWSTPPTHTHSRAFIETHKQIARTRKHAIWNKDWCYNYEKHDVLHNYRLLICDWRSTPEMTDQRPPFIKGVLVWFFCKYLWLLLQYIVLKHSLF